MWTTFSYYTGYLSVSARKAIRYSMNIAKEELRGEPWKLFWDRVRDTQMTTRVARACTTLTKSEKKRGCPKSNSGIVSRKRPKQETNIQLFQFRIVHLEQKDRLRLLVSILDTLADLPWNSSQHLSLILLQSHFLRSALHPTENYHHHDLEG